MSFKNPAIIEALWVTDSETGVEYLINVNKDEVIAKRIGGKIVDPTLEDLNVNR